MRDIFGLALFLNINYKKRLKLCLSRINAAGLGAKAFYKFTLSFYLKFVV